METIQKIALCFTVVGAVNWGLIGIMDFDLVATIFGNMTMISRIIYVIIGLCGIINIGIFFNHLQMYNSK